MKIQIKHRFSGKVLFEAEVEKDTEEGLRIKVALEAAVKVRADLQGAYLQGAYLRGAYLQGADLQGADLQGADLQGADLQGAYLQGAYLRGADLRGAYLQGAYLQGADLQGADLQEHSIVPEEGSFVGWKKCANGVIAKLQIPANAKRMSSLVGRKCRSEKVKTLALYDKDWKDMGPKASAKNGKFGGNNSKPTTYTIGKITKAENYDDDIRVECSGGIHFFITRKEAEEWG